MKYIIIHRTYKNTIWSDEYGWVPNEPPWIAEDSLFSKQYKEKFDCPVDGEWKEYGGSKK